jgi:hypothetical protein
VRLRRLFLWDLTVERSFPMLIVPCPGIEIPAASPLMGTLPLLIDSARTGPSLGQDSFKSGPIPHDKPLSAQVDDAGITPPDEFLPNPFSRKTEHPGDLALRQAK